MPVSSFVMKDMDLEKLYNIEFRFVTPGVGGVSSFANDGTASGPRSEGATAFSPPEHPFGRCWWWRPLNPHRRHPPSPSPSPAAAGKRSRSLRVHATADASEPAALRPGQPPRPAAGALPLPMPRVGGVADRPGAGVAVFARGRGSRARESENPRDPAIPAEARAPPGARRGRRAPAAVDPTGGGQRLKRSRTLRPLAAPRPLNPPAESARFQGGCTHSQTRQG